MNKKFKVLTNQVEELEDLVTECWRQLTGPLHELEEYNKKYQQLKELLEQLEKSLLNEEEYREELNKLRDKILNKTIKEIKNFKKTLNERYNV